MTSEVAHVRIKERLEKLTSNDYSWLSLTSIEDAANKSQNDWFRQQFHGVNLFKEGSEETTQRVNDLQFLIKEKPLTFISSKRYVLTNTVPDDYRYFIRLGVLASKGNCSKIPIKSSLVEEGNVDSFLADWTMQPSFDFEETFHTHVDNKFKVFHNDDFEISEITLIYYRDPKKLIFTDIDKLTEKWEMKEDVAEMIIDETVKLLSGDTENTYQYELASKRLESNN